MKDHEPYREIEDLLRADKPLMTPPPGLEKRILLAIERKERDRRRRFLPWLLMPAAAAVGIIMLWPVHESQQPPVARREPTPVVETSVVTPHVEAPHVEAAVDELVAKERRLTTFFENPLAREARALKRDARRAGHFLINALPSLSMEAD